MQKVSFNPGVMFALDCLTTVPDPVLGTPKLDKGPRRLPRLLREPLPPQLLRGIAENWDESMKEAHSPKMVPLGSHDAPQGTHGKKSHILSSEAHVRLTVPGSASTCAPGEGSERALRRPSSTLPASINGSVKRSRFLLGVIGASMRGALVRRRRLTRKDRYRYARVYSFTATAAAA